MRDYEFGDHLMMLRKSRGFSQFQLGTLVGVTDKAVSKWETGAAKPKYEILLKLASILKVDLTQLVSEEDQPSYQESKELRSRKRDLWKSAEERLYAIYGLNPPLSVVSRFSAEKNVLEKMDAIILFDILQQLQQIAKEHRTVITPRASTCCSFVAWLMGATVINPLPAHTHCPQCHRITFHPEISDGWDLPPATCECGTMAESDGHSLPFEVCICGVSDPLISVECNVSVSLLEKAWKCVIDKAKGLFTLKRYNMKKEPDDGIPCYRLYLLPGSGDQNCRNIEDVLSVNEQQHLDWLGRYPSLTLIPYAIEPESTAGAAYNLPSLNDLLQAGIMCAAIRSHFSAQEKYAEILKTNIPDPEPYLQDMSFSKFTCMLNAVSNTYTVPGPEEFAALVGFDDFTDLPLSRESLWNFLLRYSGGDYQTIGLVSEIVYKVRKGAYAKGMTETDRALFRSLNLPDWFPVYAANVRYMFPLSHSISFGYQYLIAAWNKKQA